MVADLLTTYWRTGRPRADEHFMLNGVLRGFVPTQPRGTCPMTALRARDLCHCRYSTHLLALAGVLGIGEAHLTPGQGLQGWLSRRLFSTGRAACADLIGESIKLLLTCSCARVKWPAQWRFNGYVERWALFILVCQCAKPERLARLRLFGFQSLFFWGRYWVLLRCVLELFLRPAP